MTEIIYGVAIVPLIIGLVQVLKQTGLPDRFAPVASLGLGLAFAGVQIATGAALEPFAALLTGIAYGLSASGLYSGGRAVVGA
jgi:hypothetical protein